MDLSYNLGGGGQREEAAVRGDDPSWRERVEGRREEI